MDDSSLPEIPEIKIVKVAVLIDYPQSETSVLVKLNLGSELSEIRSKLEKNNDIKMDTLLFSRKFAITNITNNIRFTEIKHEEEKKYMLHEIIDQPENDYFLYLKSRLDWKLLNNSHKLDYGCVMDFDGIKKAENQAFIMKDCKLTELLAEGYEKGDVEVCTDEEEMMQKNLLFNANINVQNFIKLGISGEKLKSIKVKYETSHSYQYVKYGKVSLEFSKYLEPTSEFIKNIRSAINSKEPEVFFKEITEKYG